MSQFITSVDVGRYTFAFHREGGVWVNTKGVRGTRMLRNMLCDPYDGESSMEGDILIPFNDYVKYEWLKVCPHMKYAYDKCGDTVTADKMAMLTYVNEYPCLEPMLNNPHNKKYACLNFMWNQTCDSPSMYEGNAARLKQAIRNFHDPSIELNRYIPLSAAHEPQYRWLAAMINKGDLDELVMLDLTSMGLYEKDMNYVIKLHAKAPRDLRLDEEWIALESYVSYKNLLRECVYEGHLPHSVLSDPYWIYPSPASYLERRNRVYALLEIARDGGGHDEFGSHMERYKEYPIDVTIDGFRFYTTTSKEDWINHSDALKQCCYRLKYYAHKDSILTFVEKGGVPYGTIDYDLVVHHILQARIDQTVYSKSIMPASVVRLFRKHVIPMLENK